jgi:hypothetical protein
MKPGDLVRVQGSPRLWVALPVTRKDIARGMNVDRPGLHLFTGYEFSGGPLSQNPAQPRML